MRRNKIDDDDDDDDDDERIKISFRELHYGKISRKRSGWR